MACAIALAGAGALAPAAARAGRLHVALDRLPCPRRAVLARELERRSADFMAAEPDLALIVELENGGRGLHLKLLGAPSPYERSIGFSRQECADLPDTLGLLVRSWIDRDWSTVAPADPPSASPPPPRGPVSADIDFDAKPPPVLQVRRRLVVVAALGGASLAVPGGNGGAASVLSAEHDLSAHWGVAVEGQFQGRASLQIDSASAQATEWGIAALARWRPDLDAAARVDLVAGPTLEIIETHSQGFFRDDLRRAPLVDGALLLGARVRLDLGERWTWVAAIELTARAHNDRLQIGNFGQELVIPPIRCMLLTGVAFEIL